MRTGFVVALLASLALTGWAVWWPTPEAADGLLPAARPHGSSPARAARPAASAAVSAAAVAAAATPHRRQRAPAAADRPVTLATRPADWPAPSARALAAWQGPPPQAAAPAPAGPAASAAAAAPVFPYQWIGQLDDGGPTQVLLASAQRSVGVRQGAVLDGRWRLDRAPGQPWQAIHLPSGRAVEVRGAPAGAAP